MKPTSFPTGGQPKPFFFLLNFRGLSCGLGYDGVRWFSYDIYAVLGSTRMFSNYYSNPTIISFKQSSIRSTPVYIG